MGEPFETSEGLLWIGAGAVPWACLADRHIYSVRLQSRYNAPPEPRPTLRWIRYVLDDDHAHLVYLEVPDGCEPPQLNMLEIGGVGRRLCLDAPRP